MEMVGILEMSKGCFGDTAFCADKKWTVGSRPARIRVRSSLSQSRGFFVRNFAWFDFTRTPRFFPRRTKLRRYMDKRDTKPTAQ